MLEPTIQETNKPMNIKACIVCGQGIVWDSTPNPACRHHPYGEVLDAIDNIKRRVRAAQRKPCTPRRAGTK